MKNILFLSTRDYDLSLEDATLEKKFVGLKKGMNVFVLARGNGNHEKYDAQFYLIPKIGTIFWMIRAVFQGRNIIKKHKIDIIISQAPLFDGLVSIILKWITRVEVIIEVHSDWINSLFLQHRLPFKGILKYTFKIWGGFVLNQADKVRVVSSSLKKLVEKNSQAKNIVKFPAFTDLEIFLKESNINYELIITYVGWLYPLKGVDTLIKAFGKIKEKYPELKLEIIGEGSERDKLEEFVQNKKIEDVEFAGRLDLNDVKNRLKRSTCLVLPSYSEGLPRVLLEAAALKKPLIGTEVGGIPEIIEDGENGFLFTPGNVEELSLSIAKLINNKKLIESMGQAGRKIILKKYSGKKFFENYFKLIK
ncbi:MAG: glycosyltransferase [Patescibacteria group bacterium]|nr:glycosyltransferase [Patescibacteria group bacterium]